MSTPLRSLPAEPEYLGREGTDEYYRCGAEVYRRSAGYVYHAGSWRAWPASKVARRIAGALGPRSSAERRQAARMLEGISE